MRRTWVLLVVIGLLVGPDLGLAVQFYLPSGTSRCFSERAPPGTRILGDYLVTPGPGSMQVDLQLRDAQGGVLLERKNILRGKFAFVVPDAPGARPRVWTADFHRRRGKGGKGREDRKETKSGGQGKEKTDGTGGGQGRTRRRLLSVEKDDSEKHVEHYADLEDEHWNDWDYDDYEGIGDEDLTEEEERQKAAHREHLKRDGVEKDEKQRFEVCLSNLGTSQPGIKRRISFKLETGESAKDYTRIANREHLTNLEVMLREVSDELSTLLYELEEAKKREDSLRFLYEGTSRTLIRFAAVAFIAMFAAGGYQAFYTRSYLKKKKVI